MIEEGRANHLLRKIDKRFNIERSKALEANIFIGTIDLVDAEKWLSLIEKCFGVMDCFKAKRVRLAMFFARKCRGLVDSPCRKVKRRRH